MIMKKNNFEKVKIRRHNNDFILTCPVCGYSFRQIDPRGLKKKVCPMCGYKFNHPDLNPLDK